MIYSADDLLRASLIGETVIVRYHDASGTSERKFRLCGIDAQSLKLQAGIYDSPQPLSLESVESIRRADASAELIGADGALRMELEDFLREKESVISI